MLCAQRAGAANQPAMLKNRAAKPVAGGTPASAATPTLPPLISEAPSGLPFRRPLPAVRI